MDLYTAYHRNLEIWVVEGDFVAVCKFTYGISGGNGKDRLRFTCTPALPLKNERLDVLLGDSRGESLKMEHK